MNANSLTETGKPTHTPLSVIVSAWDRYRVTPDSHHYLGVTITNRGDQDAVVQVRLESPSELLSQWCNQPEQWLALSGNKSGELTFCIEVPGEALPQWFDYEVVVRPQGAYADDYLPPTRCRLQILAPETSETTQDPTFTISPITTPDRPVIVQPGIPVAVELLIENRSERVDRFRLECTGLPEDWHVQIEYPRDFTGLGLVRIDESVGINPGDRGTIRAYIHAPNLPLAGHYLPTFRLASENDATLGLLALVYLRVEPTYQLQAQLQTLQDQVRDRPAQFSLQFANLGNTARQVQFALTSLSPPDTCTYTLPTDTVTLAPQTTTQVLVEGRPQHWWTRPWFGIGKSYPFRIDLKAPDHRPISPETLQGTLTWVPRPWWQLLLVVLAGLGVLGTLIFLIWWFFLRPPTPPNVLEFAAEDSRYAEANGDMARVRWQIEHPNRIQTLKLTGYSADGAVLSGPLIYEFTGNSLPAALRPFCTQQKVLLVCNQIRTDAFQPGKYVFELTLTPKGRQKKPIVLKTSPVEIAAKPFPTVTVLTPKALIYREAAAGNPTPAERAIPMVDQAGVRLGWVVTMAQDLTALHLVGRDKENKMVGEIWFQFSTPGELPDALRPFCTLGDVLICRDVPTGLNTVGEYRLELQAIGLKKPTSENGADNATAAAASEPKPKSTEVIKIQPQIPQILRFQINGKEAPAKLLVPIIPGTAPPVIQVSWQVQAGSTTQVELTPAPGSVPLMGKISLPLSPQGSNTIALQVKTATGEIITRAVTIETYDPSQKDAAAKAAGGGAAPGTPGSSAGGGANAPGAPGAAGAGTPTPFGTPAPATNDQVSPAEQPPQFNRN
ncbi:MAG: hypothetical protein KME16_26095 [Scytolyngbya sp. HA4215-MV1]|nr:hypothetical protein [Scytolyngbya sp. HA4215-MV1]